MDGQNTYAYTVIISFYFHIILLFDFKTKKIDYNVGWYNSTQSMLADIDFFKMCNLWVSDGLIPYSILLPIARKYQRIKSKSFGILCTIYQLKPKELFKSVNLKSCAIFFRLTKLCNLCRLTIFHKSLLTIKTYFHSIHGYFDTYS